MATPCYICNKEIKLAEMSTDVLQAIKMKQKPIEKLMARIKIAKRKEQSENETRRPRRLLSEICKDFMKKYYPNAAENSYHWPLEGVYEYHGTPPDLVFPNNQEETADSLVFNRLCYTLMKEKIPSFVIKNYEWTVYLSQYMQLVKRYIQHPKKGDIDVLLCLPGKCCIAIEVKGVNEQHISKTLRGKLSIDRLKGNRFDYALKVQCKKAVEVLSIVNCDLFHDKSVPLMKVIALPRCSKEALGLHFCEKCLRHIIFKEDIETSGGVDRWLQNVLEGNPINLSSDYNGDLHESVIGRLLGPEKLI